MTSFRDLREEFDSALRDVDTRLATARQSLEHRTSSRRPSPSERRIHTHTSPSLAVRSPARLPSRTHKETIDARVSSNPSIATQSMILGAGPEVPRPRRSPPPSPSPSTSASMSILQAQYHHEQKSSPNKITKHKSLTVDTSPSRSNSSKYDTSSTLSQASSFREKNTSGGHRNSPVEDDMKLHLRLREEAKLEQRKKHRISTSQMRKSESKKNRKKYIGARLNGNSLLRLRQAFKRSDLDGDGNLTTREFQRVMSELGIQVQQEEVSELSVKHGFRGNEQGENAGIDRRKSFINYDSFLQKLFTDENIVDTSLPSARQNLITRAPLQSPRSPTVVARDAAQQIFKKSGLRGQSLSLAIQKEDDEAKDGTVELALLKKRLKNAGALISDNEIEILAAANISRDPNRVDYVTLSSMLESADMSVGSEAEKQMPAHEQWWRRQTSESEQKSQFATKTRNESSVANAVGTNVNIVYNEEIDGKKVRGLGKDRKLQRQRAAIHFQRSDVLRSDDVPSKTVDSDSRSVMTNRSKHTKKSLRSAVTSGRLVESAAHHHHRLLASLTEATKNGVGVSASLLQESLTAVGVPVCYDDAKRLLNKIDPDGSNRYSASDLIRALDTHSLSSSFSLSAKSTDLSASRYSSPKAHQKLPSGLKTDARSCQSASPISLINQHKLPAAGLASTHAGQHHARHASLMSSSLTEHVSPTFATSTQLGGYVADFPRGHRRHRSDSTAQSGRRHNSSTMVARELGHILVADIKEATEQGEDIAVGVWSSESTPLNVQYKPRTSKDAASQKNASSNGVKSALLWQEDPRGSNGNALDSVRCSTPGGKGKKQRHEINYSESKAAGLVTSLQKDRSTHHHKRHLKAPVTLRGNKHDNATIYTHGYGGPRVTAAQCVQGHSDAQPVKEIHTSLGMSKSHYSVYSQTEETAPRSAKKMFKNRDLSPSKALTKPENLGHIRNERKKIPSSQLTHFSGFSGLAGLTPPKKLATDCRGSSGRSDIDKKRKHQHNERRMGTLSNQLGRGVSGLHYSAKVAGGSSNTKKSLAPKSPVKILHMKSPPPGKT